MYAEQGQYEEATEITKQSVRLAPDHVGWYGNLVNDALALQHFDEVRQIVGEAQARKLDNPMFHNAFYALAALGGDRAAMAEQQQWFAGKPDYENRGLALASDTEAYGGHVGKARELTKRAVDSAIRVPPSFRRFSITAALSGIAGQERWRIWAWLVRMPCGGEPSRERMPMPPASGRSPPTKDFLTLWKDADPDIPILREAKAECAKLQ